MPKCNHGRYTVRHNRFRSPATVIKLKRIGVMTLHPSINPTHCLRNSLLRLRLQPELCHFVGKGSLQVVLCLTVHSLIPYYAYYAQYLYTSSARVSKFQQFLQITAIHVTLPEGCTSHRLYSSCCIHTLCSRATAVVCSHSPCTFLPDLLR